MLSNAKKETSLRRRKSVTAGAGVKHRLNCLSTLSALQSHSSSSSLKKSRALSTMSANSCKVSKPIKTTTKKRQENYVIRLGNQQLMQQFTKTGSSVVVKDDDQDPDLQNLTLQQKIKVFFVLLMIPSAMVVFFGKDKFNNTSSISIDPNVQLMGGLGGMGNMAGMAGMAGLAGLPGLPRGFGGGGGGGGGGFPNGFPGSYDSDPRRHDRHERHDRMRRGYDDYDPQSIHEHLERMGQNTRHREHNREQNSEQNREHNKERNSDSMPKPTETPQNPQSNSEMPAPIPHFNSHNEVNEQNVRKGFDSNSNSDYVKPNPENNERNNENNRNFERNQNIETGDKNIGTGDTLKESTASLINKDNPKPFGENVELGFKSILMWTPIDGLVDSNQPFIDSKCVINKCIFTSNKSERSGSHAIVFDARHVTTGALPDMRSQHQKWIFFSRDSPESLETLVPVSNLFNWSWTYRSDSDIVLSNAVVKQTNGETNQLMKASDIFYIWRQKSKMILWFANNCQTITRRENYVKQLTEYIDVDILGKCSDLNNNNIDIEDENQLKSLSEKYLFVVVFEKNNCKDYVSRRLFKYLEHNMIPIVRGGADYSKIVPPNSVIDAKDFTSAKDLADFVLDIGSDFQKYKKYLEWKRNYRISYERKDLCQLCYKLHDEDNRSNTNLDIIRWWSDSSQCQPSTTGN